jgi:hypothetical protein
VTNKLDAVLAAAHGNIQLMTHVVAGYPDLDTGVRLVRAMAACGVRIIEIQIPFTDPLADGPTIMAANQAALDAGMTPEDALAWAGAVAAALPEVAVLVMTYANVPYAMGMEEFLRRCATRNIQGVIIPDLPVDEPEGDDVATARRRQVVGQPADQHALAGAQRRVHAFVRHLRRSEEEGVERDDDACNDQDFEQAAPQRCAARPGRCDALAGSCCACGSGELHNRIVPSTAPNRGYNCSAPF